MKAGYPLHYLALTLFRGIPLFRPPRLASCFFKSLIPLQAIRAIHQNKLRLLNKRLMITGDAEPIFLLF